MKIETIGTCSWCGYLRAVDSESFATKIGRRLSRCIPCGGRSVTMHDMSAKSPLPAVAEPVPVPDAQPNPAESAQPANVSRETFPRDFVAQRRARYLAEVGRQPDPPPVFGGDYSALRGW